MTQVMCTEYNFSEYLKMNAKKSQKYMNNY